MIESRGLLYKNRLKVGIDELQWLQAGDELEAMRLVLERTLRPGLVVGRDSSGGLDRRWQVIDRGAADGTVGVRTGTLDMNEEPDGVNSGRLLVIDNEARIGWYDGEDPVATVPDDASWYTLVARVLDTEYEPGTLAVTGGSATVIGTNTEFTRYSGYTGDGYDRGTLLRIDAGDSVNGNQGIYEIDAVVSDTQLTLRSVVNGTTEPGLPFTVSGDYYQGLSPADPDMHRRRIVEFELVARTRDPAAGDYVLADLMFNSVADPAVQVIDRRRGSRWLPRTELPTMPGLAVVPRLDFSIGATFVTPERAVATVHGGGVGGAGSADVTAASDGDLLFLVLETSTRLDVVRWTSATGAYAVVGTPDASGLAGHGTIVQVPALTGATHLCVYGKNQVLYKRASTDEGVTWGAETLVWDPTAIDPLDQVSAPKALLLLNHRLIVLAEYWDNSAGYWDIRWISSDDLGATWSTNGNAGTIWVQQYSAPAVRVDSRRPYLYQSEDGRILTCWDDDNGDKLSYFFSYYSTTLGRNPDGIFGLVWFGSHIDNGGVHMAPRCVCDEYGNAAIVYADPQVGVHADLRVACVSQGHVEDRRLWRSRGATATASICWPVVAKTRHGLHVGYVDLNFAPPRVDLTICDLLYQPAGLASVVT